MAFGSGSPIIRTFALPPLGLRTHLFEPTPQPPVLCRQALDTNQGALGTETFV
jgi:hypothetical protein